jgi:hypothetical protein
LVKNSKRRYPIERTRYTQAVGKLLPHRIGQIFREKGFTSWIAQGQENDVDLKVFDDEGNLIIVAEILNWTKVSLLSEKRKNCIIRNLTAYNCNKVLIYTVFKNEYTLRDLQNHGISLIKIGYQLLPKDFYNFYAKKNQTESRKIDSKETKENIKSKIIEYLQSSNIEILVSTFESYETIASNP